ncbi:efflux RND transporter periplasmic adaptor subunit [Paracoccus hibiscisoli]|uniref:HlyD family efflux transporter periplasmic adaptor subunit n=1 Tax=Paracoccus hibiscisoli TaxID=2023261 RepID=A0A4U0QNE1_9RHOB|nr:HlyD family efflux transporter periplasmic adaptor subunit [Paracoccus hibiscisoli]TJZ83349.1 HlyD family efflux transporter periplasmic adaptor subunit [Paracoccus hibiscisoli]
MRFLTRSLLGLFLTFLTLALLMLAGATLWRAMSPGDGAGGPVRGGGEQVYAARLVTVEPGRVQPQMQVFGQVRARRELQLRAGAGGRIVQMDPALQEGGTVVAGQLLARIDPAAAQAALDRSLAERADAQGVLEDARRRVDIAGQDVAASERQAELREAAVTRQAQLAERGLGTSLERETAELAASSAAQAAIASRAALADAQSAVTAAENALRRAEIAVTEARRALTDTELRAGFDGRVTAVTAVEGALVSVNEQLATIIDPDALEVQIPLSLAQFGRLIGPDGRLLPQAVAVTPDGQGDAVAVLDRAAASVAEGSAGRVVFARLTQGAQALRPGDFVTAGISEPPLEGAATIPAAAVGSDGAVLVAGDDGRLRTVAVTVLRRQGDAVVIAVPADLAGARIVAERAPQLGTGIRVRDAGDPAPQGGPDQRVQGRGPTRG